jgi:Domain of unknown function (DUF3512)
MTAATDDLNDFNLLKEKYAEIDAQKLFKSLRKLDEKEQKVCLIQRDEIGNFYYSPALNLSQVEGLDLKREISKLKIIPSTSLKRSNTILGSIKPKQTTKKLKTGIQFRSVEFIDYGTFSSFAPQFDSSLASLSPRDSTLVNKPFRRVFLWFDEKVNVEINDMVTLIPSLDSCPIISKPSPDWTKLDFNVEEQLESKPMDNQSLLKVCILPLTLGTLHTNTLGI